MDPNNEVNQNIASAYLEMLALEEKKKTEGLDAVNKDAVKKKFKDRKDKDIDNDGDEDESDEYLHNRRKTVSKEIDKDGNVDQDKPKVTSSDADSEKDNDDDRDEKGSVLKKDNDKKKTAEQTKESLFLEYGRAEREIAPDRQIELDRRAKVKIIKTKDNKFQVQRFTKGKFVNQGKPYESLKQAEKERSSVQSSMQFEENLKELGLEILDKMSEAKKPVSQMTPKEKEDDAARRKEYNAYQKSKRGGTKEEGIIDRLLAGKPKGGAKHWVTKKSDTKESVEPSLLMKRILDEKRVGDAEQNIDTWDKQVSNRRADDVLDTEMTEKEFMDMHNIDTPEFVDGPKVSNKTMDAIKNSVKSKSATRNNDSSIGESVELKEKENDMNEGMTPMQRALAKVKAQSKDKVSVKKAPWDKDDVKKEDVDLDDLDDLENVNEARDRPRWYQVAADMGVVAPALPWYSGVMRLLKKLEDDMEDRKKKVVLDESRAMPENEIIKRHIDPTIKAIADVRKTLKPVINAWGNAIDAVNDADKAVDIHKSNQEFARKPGYRKERR